MKKIIKRVLMTLILGIISVFITSIISFLVSFVLPGDRVLPYLPDDPVNPVLYDAVYHQLGYDQSIINQLFRYLGEMFVGDWGRSLSISRGFLAYDLKMDRIPSTILFLIVPIILGFSYKSFASSTDNDGFIALKWAKGMERPQSRHFFDSNGS